MPLPSRIILFAFIAMLALGSCAPATEIPAPTATPTATFAPTLTATVPPTPTPQATALPFTLGPDADDFPAPLNPLTGLAVEDPSLLKIPAQLISISHFPATARPQAGLSFAPFVWEIYITEGATRFLATFYGQYPEPEIPLTGDCPIREEPFVQTGPILGNRVWLDANANGRADAWEAGVGGVCVNLLDTSTGGIIQQMTTDSNGYYGFNVTTGEYVVEFVRPEGFAFTASDVGDDSADSDADASTGRTRQTVINEADAFLWDAGLVASSEITSAAQSSPSLPKAEVGPVRSGRLVYADIAAFYQNSCLIYAFASEEVLEQLPQCAFVTHGIQGGGYMMELERLKEVAEDHARKKADSSFNYASNVFAETAPAGGAPADRVDVYIAYQNQLGWVYDPLSQAWMRYVDDSTKANAGILHQETDRLNGRALQVENLIVVFAEVDVVSPTNLDIHLEQGDGGPALLFRDGMKYDIRWSTKSSEFEKRTGQRRPMEFLNLDGTPAALKPGHTWVLVFTPWSLVEERGEGVWFLQYLPPDGAK